MMVLGALLIWPKRTARATVAAVKRPARAAKPVPIVATREISESRP